MAIVAVIAVVATYFSGQRVGRLSPEASSRPLSSPAGPTRAPAEPTSRFPHAGTYSGATGQRPGRGACLASSSGGPYVRTNGRALTCDDHPVAMTGYTFYPALIGGARAWHEASFRGYIDQMLDMGRASGQNLIRATDQWDKNTPGQSYDDPTVWANMDYLVAAARERGTFVVVDLSAFRWLLMSQGLDPMSADLWAPFIRFVAARYRDASNVAFYSIAGEPAPPKNQQQLDALVSFYSSTTEVLRAADPNHLITAGGFNHMEDSPALGWWQAIDSLPGNDIVGFKTYSQHDLDLMPAIAAFAGSIHKPAVDEEFGMPQQYGDSSFSGGSAFNGLSIGRGPFFRAVYSSGLSLGLAGFVFWNMGCQKGPSSYEVSPDTPATWSVVTTYGAVPPIRVGATRVHVRL